MILLQVLLILSVGAASHDVLGGLGGAHPFVRLAGHRSTASQVGVDERFTYKALRHQSGLVLVRWPPLTATFGYITLCYDRIL